MLLKSINLQALYWNLHLHLWLMQQKMCIHIFQSDFYLKTNTKVIKKLKIVKSPILIMHGEVDKIVPFWMGKKMYELANEPKYSYFY